MSDITRDPRWPSQEMIQLGCVAYEKENGPVRGSHGRGIGAAIMAGIAANQPKADAECDDAIAWHVREALEQRDRARNLACRLEEELALIRRSLSKAHRL